MRKIKIRLPGLVYRFFIFTENGWLDMYYSDGAKSSRQDVLIQHEDRRMVSMD
jgi:hypothetical protein